MKISFTLVGALAAVILTACAGSPVGNQQEVAKPVREVVTTQAVVRQLAEVPTSSAAAAGPVLSVQAGQALVTSKPVFVDFFAVW